MDTTGLYFRLPEGVKHDMQESHVTGHECVGVVSGQLLCMGSPIHCLNALSSFFFISGVHLSVTKPAIICLPVNYNIRQLRFYKVLKDL